MKLIAQQLFALLYRLPRANGRATDRRLPQSAPWRSQARPLAEAVAAHPLDAVISCSLKTPLLFDDRCTCSIVERTLHHEQRDGHLNKTIRLDRQW